MGGGIKRNTGVWGTNHLLLVVNVALNSPWFVCLAKICSLPSSTFPLHAQAVAPDPWFKPVAVVQGLSAAQRGSSTISLLPCFLQLQLKLFNSQPVGSSSLRVWWCIPFLFRE